jgi:hypothetical protein
MLLQSQELSNLALHVTSSNLNLKNTVAAQGSKKFNDDKSKNDTSSVGEIQVLLKKLN